MPRKKYERERRRPTFKKRSDALRHGHIQYGQTNNGARNFIVYKVRRGWRVVPK
jgi:hypothetical protein